MYIIKNAVRCICRAKGRNILIGIILLVIAISACIGLSIRQAADSARESALSELAVTATISYDRQGMMQGMQPPDMSGGFDIDSFKEQMGNVSSLSLDEYKKYAQAKSVKSFYYTLTVYLDGASVSPISTESSSSIGGGFGGFGGMGGFGGGASGDFTVIGYSDDSAMASFKNGSASISDGTVFDEGTQELHCIISSELAVYNSLSVGDEISLVNPSLDTESYTLKIVGIYSSTETNSAVMGGMGSDPANEIYMSYTALQSIVDASETAGTTLTDDEGNEYESALTGALNATYSFASVADYESFEEQARKLGLSEDYTVSSQDLSAFESSIAPLETLSTMAGWFLIIMLVIGSIILVVLNIFNIRERKYEIGVLTAMGMKKIKVAMQFVCEILIVTMIAVVIGAGIGAVSSVPVTNALLEGQIESSQERESDIENSFGRPSGMGGAQMPEMPDGADFRDKPDGIFGGTANYISEINSAMNLTVVLQMMGIGLLLTLAAGGASVMFVMRYDPLKILSNRD